MKRLSTDLGVHPEALRGWIWQAEVDVGERDDRPTTAEREELADLRSENTQLKPGERNPADAEHPHVEVDRRKRVERLMRARLISRASARAVAASRAGTEPRTW
ncbi:transposase [Streptomyces sp. NPDC002911]